jgi:hypothetical protein
VHKEHRKYEGAVAENELGKKRSDAGLAKKLHSMRPGYAASDWELTKLTPTPGLGLMRLKPS